MQLERIERQSPGLFVTLEGPEGSGKSTQSERLGARLRAAGIPCLVTREPGGTAVGERIRQILLDLPELDPTPAVDVLLFNAARTQHVVEVIRPALARGEVVICDRYADSTVAYQGYGAGEPLDEVRALCSYATGGLRPDLTLLLDLPVEAGLDRKARTDEQNRFEARHDEAFHRRVREGFLTLAAAEPARWVVVDGSAAAAAIEEACFEAIVARLSDPLRNRAKSADSAGESRKSSDPPRAHARTNR